MLFSACGLIGPPIRAYPLDSQTSQPQPRGLDASVGVGEALKLGGSINKMFLDNFSLPSFFQVDLFKLMDDTAKSGAVPVTNSLSRAQSVQGLNLTEAQSLSMNDLYAAGRALFVLILQIFIAILSVVIGILRAGLAVILNS